MDWGWIYLMLSDEELKKQILKVDSEEDVTIDTTTSSVSTDTIPNDDILRKQILSIGDTDIDTATLATDKVGYTPVKEKLPFQETLYNHYSKTNPELFRGGKLDDIEGAIEKGIITEYSFVPTGEAQDSIKPHSSTTYESNDGFPPTSYIYNETNEVIEEQRLAQEKKTLDEQMSDGFRVAKLFNEEDVNIEVAEMPDAYGKYTTTTGDAVEIPFMNGTVMEGVDTSNLTEVLNEEGQHVVQDSLLKQMGEIPVVGNALFQGLMEVAESIDYVPAAFKDAIETAGNQIYKSKTVWDAMNASLKFTSNRSFKDPKDMAEQLADGAGSFLEFVESQMLASPVSGMTSLVTRASGLTAAKGASKEARKLDGTLYKDYVSAVKQVKRQDKDAKWLANRLEKAINIERIKYATDVEMKGKTDAAKKIADENKGIRNELINSFENTTKKTISKTDELGNKTLDYEAARTAGLELLKDNATPELAAKIAPRIDELTHPILKPEKLDGLVAVAKELQKKNPDAFNNKNTLIDNLFDLTVGKDMNLAESMAGSSGDELLNLLNQYGLSFEDYILTVVGSGSQAGKVLNKLSQIKRTRPLSEAQLLAQKAAEAADSSILNYAMRIENIRRGGLVSQIATASRNLFSGSIRAPLESLANVMDTALYNLSTEGTGAAVKSLVSKQNWKDSFSNLKYIYDDPKATKQLTDFIMDRPELINQYELMLNNLNEIQKVMGRGTGSTFDKIVSKGEDAVSFLNTPNRWQEYLIRRGSYLGELQRLIKNEYKIDLLDTLNEGKLKDLLNDAGTVRPKGARSFNEISADATKRALDVTYAKQPDVPIFREISTLLTKSIVGTMVMPFPRFMFNSMELMGQYMAGASIPLTRKLMSIVAPPLRGPLTAKDRQRISRNLVGLAAIGGFYQGYKFLSEDDKSPTDYKMLPVADGTVLDLTPLYPLRPYAYIGKAMEKIDEGTFEDWFDSKEFLETFIGTNIRTGVGNGLLTDMVETITGGEDLGTFARAGKISGRAVGSYLSTWAVPFAQLLEAQRITGDRGTEYKDLAPEPTFDFSSSFMNEVKRPFDSRGFTDISGKTEADAPKREFLFQETKSRISPASRVFLGLNLSTADTEDGEYLKELGYVDFQLGSKSESPKVRRFENTILREVLPTVVDVAQSMEKYYEKQYRRQKVGFKETVSKEKFMQANLQPIIDRQFTNIKRLLNDGKIATGGPYVKAMIEYKRLPKGHRKWAAIEFMKMSKDSKPADATNTKDLQKLTKIGETYGKAITKSLGSRK